MTTFALLHGGAHGSWCWERVTPMLQDRGFGVVAPDLPMADLTAGVGDWAQVAVSALAEVPDEVVVVGHSMGGLAVPVVASLRPVQRMVFLGAMVPMPGMSYAEYLGTEEGAGAITMPLDRTTHDEEGRTIVPPAVAAEVFYADCTAVDSERAIARLTPNAATAFVEPCPIDAWPDVASSYILMTSDLAVGNDWSRRVASDRLGVTPIELPGSHSPFYSRPAELVDVLLSLE